ncbi:MAG TPA: HAD-IA family hydrolase [Cytophagaceae bacterium]|jgi:phosphoglycolate phosphatase
MPAVKYKNMKEFDSIIFDMDGTLWDATDSYVECWNIAAERLKFPTKVDRKMLESVMGWDEKKAYEFLFPELEEEKIKQLASTVSDIQDELIPQLGGEIYEGVQEGLKSLSTQYRLFILSNCPKHTIKQFMKFAKIEDLISGSISFGENRVPKSENIKLLVDRYELKNPVYVGDTNSDRVQCERAGLPFVYVSYGFDKVDEYYKSFDNFTSLKEYFLDSE